jgi:hypothetical protein
LHDGVEVTRDAVKALAGGAGIAENVHPVALIIFVEYVTHTCQRGVEIVKHLSEVLQIALRPYIEAFAELTPVA